MEPSKINPHPEKPFTLNAILRALCPACHRGKINEGLFSVRTKCLQCGYSFYPESGFYLGAIAVGFLVTAALTIPPMIFLKLLNVEMEILLGFPFIEFLFLGTFLTFYSKILWLHLEYRISRNLDPTTSHQDSEPPKHEVNPRKRI